MLCLPDPILSLYLAGQQLVAGRKEGRLEEDNIVDMAAEQLENGVLMMSAIRCRTYKWIMEIL